MFSFYSQAIKSPPELLAGAWLGPEPGAAGAGAGGAQARAQFSQGTLCLADAIELLFVLTEAPKCSDKAQPASPALLRNQVLKVLTSIGGWIEMVFKVPSNHSMILCDSVFLPNKINIFKGNKACPRLDPFKGKRILFAPKILMQGWEKGVVVGRQDVSRAEHWKTPTFAAAS